MQDGVILANCLDSTQQGMPALAIKGKKHWETVWWCTAVVSAPGVQMQMFKASLERSKILSQTNQLSNKNVKPGKAALQCALQWHHEVSHFQ